MRQIIFWHPWPLWLAVMRFMMCRPPGGQNHVFFCSQPSYDSAVVLVGALLQNDITQRKMHPQAKYRTPHCYWINTGPSTFPDRSCWRAEGCCQKPMCLNRKHSTFHLNVQQCCTELQKNRILHFGSSVQLKKKENSGENEATSAKRAVIIWRHTHRTCREPRRRSSFI